MINIIDTCRNVVGDKYAMVKILILTIPTMICVYSKLGGNDSLYNVLNLIFGIIYAAIFFETIRRSCNSEPMLLPPFMLPFRMFITLGLTILAAIPITAVCIGLCFGYFEFLKYSAVELFSQATEVPWTIKVFNALFAVLTSSLFFASITQFLDSGKVWDAYNPIKVLTAWKTFIVNTIAFIIQNIIFILLIMVVPAYIIAVVAGMQFTNFFVILWMSMCGVLNYLMWADFYGQTKKESEVY